MGLWKIDCQLTASEGEIRRISQSLVWGGGGGEKNFIEGDCSQNLFFFLGKMAAAHTLSISTALCTASLTTPSGWVVLGVVGAVCVTVAVVTVVVEKRRKEGKRKQK